MYALSVAQPVNPQGTPVSLTRAQVWKGLVMKARDAVPFVPGMSSCRVVEDYDDDSFLREVVYRGETIRELIKLTPDIQVHFNRVHPADDRGWITNVVSELSGELILTFTFAVVFPGISEGSDEETRKGEEMREAYVAAIASTLAKVRAMARAGQLA